MDRKDDALWHDRALILIAPHPNLTDDQKAIIEKDYGMKNGKTDLKVRYAMLFYLLKRLNLLDDAAKRSPRSQHIVAVDREAVQAALKTANFTL